LSQFYSDNSFTRSVIKYADISSQFTPTYFYEFSYDGEIGGNDIEYEGAEHVAHNEELNYLFGNTDYHQYSEADQLTQQRLMKIWTDFAKYQLVIFDWKCRLY
jgi:carboxylesterase type B